MEEEEAVSEVAEVEVSEGCSPTFRALKSLRTCLNSSGIPFVLAAALLRAP